MTDMIKDRRRVKPYPSVPDDIKTDTDEDWLSLTDLLISMVWIAVIVLVVLMAAPIIFMIGYLI